MATTFGGVGPVLSEPEFGRPPIGIGRLDGVAERFLDAIGPGQASRLARRRG